MKQKATVPNFKLVPFVNKRLLNDLDEATEDIQYWLAKPAYERIAAVTFLVSLSLAQDERIDKTMVTRKRLKNS